MDLITVTRENGLGFQVRIRDHVIPTDMSLEEGGTDSGPSPVEILGGAMGACLATMIQAFCDARGYGDGDVSVSLTLELASAPNRVAGLVADVELPADMPEEEKEKLRTLAPRLPVPATFLSEPRMDIDFL
jgi:putative redox protein